VTGGDEIAIATREAIVGDDLDHLEAIVLNEFHQRVEAERTARTESLELQMKAIRQIVRYLRPDKPGARDAGPRNVGL
jgi:F-type H+-transporting ATPase subunit epsilon